MREKDGALQVKKSRRPQSKFVHGGRRWWRHQGLKMGEPAEASASGGHFAAGLDDVVVGTTWRGGS